MEAFTILQNKASILPHVVLGCFTPGFNRSFQISSLISLLTRFHVVILSSTVKVHVISFPLFFFAFVCPLFAPSYCLSYTLEQLNATKLKQLLLSRVS